ncbi:XRE family transcriptional regulator [Streptacidiphilus fuscans]|uniref:XRE family transcriptional regulator n=1 Tax=Streptacidiphilus fuscans TaxID=2789292 RepID=A0A931B069_9ACTN|nr:XRE family transcriptional regulator [Streptacidiphilus fuscans]MBF9068019.1 XRE family transcriptional regulator [Streptacidiphilus fuscans]
MSRRAGSAPASPVPFDPAAARAVRSALGLSPAMVARALSDSYAMRVPPALVIAWETGATHPTERELVALARVLWCLPGQLMGGRATTLRDYRLALDLPLEEVARRLRLSVRDYTAMETRWDGDRNETLDLARVLQLSPRALVRACGREERLDEVLRRAVDGRWQSQVEPARELVPTLSEEWITHALKSLAGERATSSALWGSTSASNSSAVGSGAAGSSASSAASEAGRQESPDAELSERFWALMDI